MTSINSMTKSHSVARRLPVQWLEAPAEDVLLTLPASWCWRGAGRRPLLCQRKVRRSLGGLRGFTLLELMLVIAIIGFISAMTLTHIGGFGRASVMPAAIRQLLDDVALARQRAMVNRSTVYMVFLPPSFWTNAYFPVSYAPIWSPQMTNLLMHQYNGYALVSLATVGDQPGQHFAHYVSDWKFLPDGVFFAPFQFSLTNTWTNIYTTNTLSGVVTTSALYPWTQVPVPFPSVFPLNNTTMPMPCIGFTAQGGLATPFTNQYIALARGSVFYPTDTNGLPQAQPPSMVETPDGNDANNPNMIQIDWMTGRATVVQNQMQ